MDELVLCLYGFVFLVKLVGMGFNIDVEEVDCLFLFMDVIEVVLVDLVFKEWDGFGVVVQVYGKCVVYMLDYFYEFVICLDCKIMVCLVKGVYWDIEIKNVQVMGFDGFFVFMVKVVIDVSYIVNVCKLFGMIDWIYLQFVMYNVYIVVVVLGMVEDFDIFEF